MNQIHLLEKVAQFKEKLFSRKWEKCDEAAKKKIEFTPELYRCDEQKKTMNK